MYSSGNFAKIEVARLDFEQRKIDGYHCHFVTLQKLTGKKYITMLCIISIDFNLYTKTINFGVDFGTCKQKLICFPN